ncbi:MAG: DUF2914 domain-containing protein [Desulfobulbaceae bacterium]|nr:DUF2914 domain-containing protein [Desulfobulbaceae bacterium]
MRKIFLSAATLALLVTLGFVSAAKAEEAAKFTIARLVVCTNVDAMEPELGTDEKFPLRLGKVSCFLEARQISADTTIRFVWKHNGVIQAKIPVLLKKGWRWRTYSHKKLDAKSGNWSVEIHDANGAVVDTVTFAVE